MLQINLFDYLAESARRAPDRPALTDEAETLSFSALLSRALCAGAAVAERCAPRRPVVVLAARTAAAAAALQGVLAAGCYYVPVDPKTPALRLAAMLAQLHDPLVLCPDGLEADLHDAAPGCACLPFSALFAAVPDAAALEARRAAVIDADPAYMIFTSGSTGTPKGIVVSHRSVIDFTEWMADFCRVTENDVLANQAPFFFDLSVKDLYTTLKCGARLLFPPQRCYLFPLELARYLDERGVTALFWATSAFHLLASSGALAQCPPRALRIAALGGEALQARQVNAWRRACPGLEIVNLYGPTEATVDCAAYRLDRDFADGEPIPIGTACRNKELLLLDEALRPVPAGEVGELCVRGAGLAKGYFGDGARTREAFVQNPLSPDVADLIYRTGDLALRGPDGLLYFRARRDGQIKHMGYRIELGEVETAVLAEGDVDAAACLYDRARGRIVCVYAGRCEGPELARALRRRLPKYMLPNVYHRLDALPMTPNGKTDRAALRERYAP